MATIIPTTTTQLAEAPSPEDTHPHECPPATHISKRPINTGGPRTLSTDRHQSQRSANDETPKLSNVGGALHAPRSNPTRDGQYRSHDRRYQDSRSREDEDRRGHRHDRRYQDSRSREDNSNTNRETYHDSSNRARTQGWTGEYFDPASSYHPNRTQNQYRPNVTRNKTLPTTSAEAAQSQTTRPVRRTQGQINKYSPAGPKVFTLQDKATAPSSSQSCTTQQPVGPTTPEWLADFRQHWRQVLQEQYAHIPETSQQQLPASIIARSTHGFKTFRAGTIRPAKEVLANNPSPARSNDGHNRCRPTLFSAEESDGSVILIDLDMAILMSIMDEQTFGKLSTSQGWPTDEANGMHGRKHYHKV